MRIGFHNPYFDGFGGGERYTLTLASHWSKIHEVSLFWNKDIRNEAAKRFAIDLSKVKITHNIFQDKNFLKKLFLSRAYDLIFFLSDGSIPTSFAKHNILHFQVPFSHVESNPLKLSRFQVIVCNSLFTKTHLDSRISKRSSVIYPPVNTKSLHAAKKKRQILSVGRFSSHFQAKKQLVIIEAFRKGKKRLSGWKLILTGGLLSTDRDFYAKLQKQRSDAAIEFYPNTSYANLKKLYEESMVYWHAAGFKESNPAHAEHFGISTVEAMAAGCIPIVYKGGGQPEIVEHKKNGFLWQTIDELIDYTVAIESKSVLFGSIQKEAIKRAGEFDEAVFTRKFDEVLHSITR